MWIKRQRVEKKSGKIYEYVYLTESFRDANGRSCHRQIANLSSLSDLQLANLERALRAGARGESLVVADGTAHRFAKVSASYRFLDVATFLELWRDWKLDELCAEVLPRGEMTQEPADVVAVLALQRALEPDSKLAAVDWFARTALPELVGLSPSAFSNSRIHRVLSCLESAEEQLQRRLSYRCRQQTGQFVSLFLDATDTFFVGRGPSIATKGKTKEGRYERKVGIVLLCNERGEPLRWKVVKGTSAESKDFHQVFIELTEVDWAQNVPVAVDRAMGTTAAIESMAETGLHFVTALNANEYDSYAPEMPRTEVGAAELELDAAKDVQKNDSRRLVALVQKHGLKPVNEDLLILDLGVREVRIIEDGRPPGPCQSSLRQALQTGLEVRSRLESGELVSFTDAASVYGYSKGWINKRVQLSRMSEVIREDILTGHAENLPLRELAGIASRPLEEQDELYFRLKGERRGKTKTPNLTKTPHRNKSKPTTLVRQVLYFCPTLHLQKRRTLFKQIGALRCYVDHLNQDITDGRKRLSQQRLCAQVEAKLAKLNLRRAFDVSVATDGIIELVEDSQYLTQLRGRFGFCVLVAHQDIVAEATDLVQIYRAKNTVEYDFKTIKSCVKLRPVRHRNAEKIRAHVTLCMLALLLHRSLASRLNKLHMSSERAVAELQTCPLNFFAKSGVYSVTELNRTQRQILEQLGLEALADDKEISRRIRPRDRF